jgi:hypothetical protein
MNLPKTFLLVLIVASGLLLALRTLARPHEAKWDFSLENRVSRCFKTEQVSFACDSDVVSDKGEVSAELQVLAVDVNGTKFNYGYGKSIEGGLCQRHLTKIKKLVRGVDQVCIGGDGEVPLSDGTVYIRWRDLETKRGKTAW